MRKHTKVEQENAPHATGRIFWPAMEAWFWPIHGKPNGFNDGSLML